MATFAGVSKFLGVKKPAKKHIYKAESNRGFESPSLRHFSFGEISR